MEWEWIIIFCVVVTLAGITSCLIYYWKLYTVEPQMNEIDLSAFNLQPIEPVAQVETEISAFDAHIQEIQRPRVGATADLPPSYEEVCGAGVGLRHRTSRDENLTAEDVINAGRDETDVPGSSGVASGAARQM